jgi:hypothetical protein
MEVSGQPYFPVSLLRKSISYIHFIGGWVGPRTGRGGFGDEKNVFSVQPIETQDLGHPARSLITIPTTHVYLVPLLTMHRHLLPLSNSCYFFDIPNKDMLKRSITFTETDIHTTILKLSASSAPHRPIITSLSPAVTTGPHVTQLNAVRKIYIPSCHSHYTARPPKWSLPVKLSDENFKYCRPSI